MSERHAARPDPRLQVPMMPSGTEVASYASYLEAQAAVDYLSDSGFDVKSITIVGTDLHLVERVTGRLTTGRVALSGASSGALWGGFMGVMVSFASSSASASLWILAGMAGGALAGVVMSVLLYMMTGGQRDFTSQSQVVASRYAVLASADVARAFELLQKTPGNQRRPVPKRVREEREGPTEYGSRPDEKPRFGVRLSDVSDEAGAAASSSEAVGDAGVESPLEQTREAPESGGERGGRSL